MLAPLGPQHRAVVEMNGARCAVLATLTAARRMLDAVEHVIERNLMARLGSDLDHLPQAATIAAIAPRTVPQFLAPEHDRSDMLGGFDGHRMHAARESRGGQTVERRTGACSPGVEEQHFSTLTAIGGGIGALQRANADMQVPESAGAFRGNRAGQHLMHGAQDRIRDQMAEHVTDSDRSRTLRIEDAVGRRRDLERQQRCVVVRDLGRQRALQGVAGIGGRVDDRAVDAERTRSRCAGEIHQDVIGGDIHVIRRASLGLTQSR